MTPSWARQIVAMSFLLLPLFAGAATAQELSKEHQSPSSPNETTALPEMTVHAQPTDETSYVIPNATSGTKTDTPIMETPLNIQVIPQQVLKDQQVITLDQALKNVSGVTTNSSNFTQGNQAILLRGFASTTYFRNGLRLRDGVTTRPMANVESIEVLKGPAAILYGQVEPGGMVNVITKQPLAAPFYALQQQFGSFDLYRTSLDATGPVTKDNRLLYRINLSYEDSGSFRDFVKKKDVFVAPVLKWNISPRTQATFEFEYNHQHAGQDYGFLPLLDGHPLNISLSRNYGEYLLTKTETIFGGFNWAHEFNEDWSITHRFSINQQRVIQPHIVFPFEVTNEQVTRLAQSFDTQNDTYATSLDLIGHFAAAGLQHTLLFGGDYYRLSTNQIVTLGDTDTIDLLNPVHPGTPFVQPLQPFLHNNNHTDQYGLYMQDQMTLPYHVYVTGGIRYQYLHQANKERIGHTSSAKTDEAVTPRVGILWRPQSWLSFYANYMENFGPNDPFATIFPGTLPPPTDAHQYEGGIKTEFLDGRLRATVAYYDLTKTNVATRDPIHNGFSLVTGAVRSRGPEVDIQGEILPGWNVIATYANIDARVTKSNDDSSSPTAVGSRFFNTPRNMGSVWSTYEAFHGNLRGMKIGGGVTLRDSQTGCCDKPAVMTPGYATVDMLAAYSFTLGTAKVTAQLNTYNLLDKHYYSSITSNGVGLSGVTAAYADFAPPRTVLGSLQVEW